MVADTDKWRFKTRDTFRVYRKKNGINKRNSDDIANIYCGGDRVKYFRGLKFEFIVKKRDHVLHKFYLIENSKSCIHPCTHT